MKRGLGAAGAFLWLVVSCVGADPDSSTPDGNDAGTTATGDATSRACAPTDRTCVGAEMRGCAPDGSGFLPAPLETCENEALCKAGLAGGTCAAPACASGEMKCEGADRFACLPDRTGFAPAKTDTCSGDTPVCAAGKCVTCATGSRRCTGKTPEACVAESWKQETACLGSVTSMCMAGDCLDARFARWPMPNEASSSIRPAKYTVVSANIVRDEVTGLEWQRGMSANEVDIAGGATRAHCETIVVDGQGGFHTPTPVELLSLVDYGKGAAPFIDTAMFADTPASGIIGSWTGVSWPRIDYSTGLNPTESTTGYSYKLRCVRAPKPVASTTPRFTVANGEVTDSWTKLVWKQANFDDFGGYTQADTGCTALGGGFRLPTVKELYTLVDPTAAAAPYIDQTAFPGTVSDMYWSKTNDPLGTGALAVDFSVAYGAIKPQIKSGNGLASRCVK